MTTNYFGCKHWLLIFKFVYFHLFIFSYISNHNYLSGSLFVLANMLQMTDHFNQLTHLTNGKSGEKVASYYDSCSYYCSFSCLFAATAAPAPPSAPPAPHMPTPTLFLLQSIIQWLDERNMTHYTVWYDPS